MNKKSKKLFYMLGALATLIFVELLYLSNEKSMTLKMQSKKNSFVELTGLPDLAISTEATYVRHRSLSGIFSIYKDDTTLREYFPSTYVISHSHVINKKDKI